MKRMLIVLVAVGMFTMGVTADAFDLGVGARYVSVPMPNLAVLLDPVQLTQIIASGNPVLPAVGVGIFQGEILLGSLQIGVGYADGVIPITVGFLSKFPIPLVSPYIGTDFTYYLMPGLAQLGANVHTFGGSAKVGAEVRFGSIAGYGGIGYGGTVMLMSIANQMLPIIGHGITWEIGGRYYFF